MIPRQARRMTLLVLLALCIGGCSLLNPHFERPRLALAGVEMQGTQLLKQRFRVRIRVENPNDRALPIRALDFTMQLGGEDLGSGAIEAPFTVPARDHVAEDPAAHEGQLAADRVPLVRHGHDRPAVRQIDPVRSARQLHAQLARTRSVSPISFIIARSWS